MTINTFTESFRTLVCSNTRYSDMSQPTLGVTDTKDNDWAVTIQSTQERFSSGITEIQGDKRIGSAKMIYTRVFHPDRVMACLSRCGPGIGLGRT